MGRRRKLCCDEAEALIKPRTSTLANMIRYLHKKIWDEKIAKKTIRPWCRGLTVRTKNGLLRLCCSFVLWIGGCHMTWFFRYLKNNTTAMIPLTTYTCYSIFTVSTCYGTIRVNITFLSNKSSSVTTNGHALFCSRFVLLHTCGRTEFLHECYGRPCPSCSSLLSFADSLPPVRYHKVLFDKKKLDVTTFQMTSIDNIIYVVTIVRHYWRYTFQE